MKNILLKALYALGFVSSINFINAQCSLDQVGAPNYSVTSQFSDLAVAPNGKLYSFAYNSGVGKFYLHSISSPSSSWTPVANISGSTAIKPVVQVSKTGKVYVVLKDDAAGQVGKVFYESAGTFIQLGASFSGTDKVSDLSIAFNSLGEEYVAYTDLTNGNKSTVKKWDGTSWIPVGSGIVSIGAGYYNSLIIDKTDSPVLAFQDLNAGNKISVYSFDGTSWNLSTSVGSSPSNAKLKLGQNGDYYLGYTEDTNNAIVQKYDGLTWNPLGLPVTNLSPNPNTFDLELDPNDLPYFIALNNTSFYAVAFKYTGAPTWSNVIGGNISSITSVNVNVAVDFKGNPYFSYIDQPSNYGINVKTITSPISISLQPVSVTRCNGQSGSFSVGTVGGIPTSYQWQTLGAGTYTNSSAPYNNVTTANLAFTANTSMNQNQVRCVVNIGCKNIISNTPTLTVVTLSATTTSTNPTCFNTGDGAISAIVTGGVSPYTYTWSPVGGNTPNPTGLFWNTYTLTSADLNGCAITKTVALTSPPSLNTSFSGNMNICSGSITTLTITASGGTPGYTYSWTPGGSLSTTTGSVVIANPGTTQTYNVSVTDALGCVATDTVMVNVTASPVVTGGSNSTICNGSFATLNASGTSNTYSWNPGALIGAVQNVNPGTTTTYTVVGTNTLTGCTNSATVLITVNPLPTVNAGPSRTLTCANTSTTLAGSTTGGVSYSWTGPGIVSGATTLNPTINAAGTYDLTVTSAQGCSAGPSPVTVFQNITPPTPTASNSSTLTCSTTTATLSGSGGGTYNWAGPGIIAGATTSAPTINLPGTYNLTVTAANGCTATANTTVTQNTVIPTTTASNSSTLTCVTTTVSLIGGPAAGVSYQWSGAGFSGGTTSQNAIANAAGVYTLLATSLTNGCSKTATTSLTQNVTPPTATASNSSTLTCSTTTAMLTGTGGGTYSWSGPSILSGGASPSPIINSAGCYTLVLTSAINGCTATANTCITQNTISPGITGGVSGTLTCITSTVNAISATTVTPVTFAWTGTGIVSGAATASVTVNQPGIFSYTVSNSTNGCKSTGTRVISQNTVAPSGVNAGSDQIITCTNPTVTLSGSVSTPTNATYNWSGGVCGSPTNSITSACAGGTYTLTATNPINGCTNFDLVLVTLDNAIPTVSLSANTGTLTCANTTASIVATTTVGSVNYNWSPGTGIMGGSGSTNTPVFNAPGSYSLVLTNFINGCATNIVNNVVTIYQNSSLPTITLTPSFSICSGNSATLTAASSSDPNSIYVWNPGTLNGAIQNVTPNLTTTYTLSVTNIISSCVNTQTTLITVNSTPTLAVSGNTNICKGSTTNLTASGATSYTWNSGPNTTTISVTPTITTTYTLIGDNGNGCSSLLPVTVSIIPNKAISGVVTSTNGATGGDIIIYKYTSALSHWDSLTITPIGGTYTFNNIDSGLYVLRAMPTATNIQVTYAPNSISWQGAGVINHGCTNNTSQNIDLIGFAPYTVGPGVLTGNIEEAFGFVPRMSNESKPMVPGTPIGGIIVKGGKNPGGQMFVQTITDAAGNYTLTGLPVNTLPDDYFIFVDIPGLDTNGTYYHISVTGSTPITGFDFNVDAQYINPIGSVTGISNDNSVLENKITLFPNPANNHFTLEYELTQSAKVSIELFDVVGHKVKTISSNSFKEKDKHSHSTNIEDLSTGVYFIKVKINDSETTVKLIIN